MPTCVSAVRTYGYLQETALQSADVFLNVGPPPQIFLSRLKWKLEPEGYYQRLAKLPKCCT